jgi:PTS system ascorbate-specific IIC component
MSLQAILNFVVEFFGTPAIVLGLVALIGLVVQRKPFKDVFVGTLKTILGFLIMLAGIGTLISALAPVSDLVFAAYGLEGFFPQDEAVVAAVAPVLGRETALILAFGFLVNVLLARITPWKYIYLTGHMMWIHAGVWAITLHVMGLPFIWVVVIGTIVQGLYTTLFPAWAQPFMRKITGSDDIGFGHGQTLLNVVAGYLGRFVGNPEQSAEEVKMPSGLEFFRDMSVSMSIIMLLVSVPAVLVVGPGYVEENISGGQNFLIFAILQALGFTAGVLILLQGVRMFIADLVPAFKGIADKVIPGAVPALDCPVIYPYAPTALLIGLVTGTIAQLVAIALIIGLGWAVPLPNMIGAFFASGSGAIFGNSTGGIKGAILGGFLWCFVGWLLGAWAYEFGLFGDLASLGAENIGFLVPDGILIAGILRLIGMPFGLTP